MEKRLIKTDVGDGIIFLAGDDDAPTSIDDVIKWFTESKEEGATHVDWITSTDCHGDNEECIANTITAVLETDDQFQKRVDAAEDKKNTEKNKIEISERRKLSELKAKYE
jgi:hypothetical protein